MQMKVMHSKTQLLLMIQMWRRSRRELIKSYPISRSRMRKLRSCSAGKLNCWRSMAYSGLSNSIWKYLKKALKLKFIVLSALTSIEWCQKRAFLSEVKSFKFSTRNSCKQKLKWSMKRVNVGRHFCRSQIVHRPCQKVNRHFKTLTSQWLLSNRSPNVHLTIALLHLRWVQCFSLWIVIKFLESWVECAVYLIQQLVNVYFV